MGGNRKCGEALSSATRLSHDLLRRLGALPGIEQEDNQQISGFR